MAGEVSFTPSEADYVAAGRANFLVQLRRPRFRRRLVLTLAALFAGIAAFDMWFERDLVAAATYALIATGGAVIGLMICMAGTFLLLPRRMGRLFRQQRGLHHEQQFAWSDNGAVWSGPKAHVELPWDDYYQWHESRAAFLLFLNERMPHYLPRRLLSEMQAADLRATLVAHGPPRR